jgi:hypothetical protein
MLRQTSPCNLVVFVRAAPNLAASIHIENVRFNFYFAIVSDVYLEYRPAYTVGNKQAISVHTATSNPMIDNRRYFLKRNIDPINNISAAPAALSKSSGVMRPRVRTLSAAYV